MIRRRIEEAQALDAAVCDVPVPEKKEEPQDVSPPLEESFFSLLEDNELSSSSSPSYLDSLLYTTAQSTNGILADADKTLADLSTWRRNQKESTEAALAKSNVNEIAFVVADEYNLETTSLCSTAEESLKSCRANYDRVAASIQACTSAAEDQSMPLLNKDGDVVRSNSEANHRVLIRHQNSEAAMNLHLQQLLIEAAQSSAGQAREEQEALCKEHSDINIALGGLETELSSYDMQMKSLFDELDRVDAKLAQKKTGDRDTESPSAN